MAETWDLYDINRKSLNVICERGVPLKDGEFHTVVEVWVINRNNQMLLTQRHPSKPWGSYWECSGGAILAGENSFDGAKRELLEETGIDASDKPIMFLGTKKYKEWFTDSFIVKIDVSIEDLKLQAEEVTNVLWVDIKEFEDMSLKELIVPNTIERFNSYREKMF